MALTLPAIRMIVHVLSSERDRNGNSYHACTWTDTYTGVRVTVRDCDSPSNAAQVCYSGLRLQHGEYTVIESVIPKRQWEGATKGWPVYLTDAADTIRKAIAVVCCPDGMACEDPHCKAIGYRL